MESRTLRVPPALLALVVLAAAVLAFARLAPAPVVTMTGKCLGFALGEFVHLICTPYLFALAAGLLWIFARTVSGRWFAPKVAR